MFDYVIIPHFNIFEYLISVFMWNVKPKYVPVLLKHMDKPDGYTLSIGVIAYYVSGYCDSAENNVIVQMDGYQKLP